MLVNKSDYKNHSGVDLEIELKGFSDNITSYVDIMLKRAEAFVRDYIKMLFFQSEWNEEVLKQAIMYQIDYILENGNDNKLAPLAYQHLRVNGMANMAQGRFKRYG